jgi:hypothetical protein
MFEGVAAPSSLFFAQIDCFGRLSSLEFFTGYNTVVVGVHGVKFILDED